MDTKKVVATVALSLALTSSLFAQRVLDRGEVLEIFEQLTAAPRTGWLSAGAIEGTRRQYQAPKLTDSAEISAEIEREIQRYLDSADKPEVTEELQKMRVDAIPFNVRYRQANEWSMTTREIVRYDGDRFYWEIDVDSRQDSVQLDASLAGNFMTKQFDMSLNRRRIAAWDGQKYTTYAVSGGLATVDAAGRLPRAVNGPLTAGIIPWGHGAFSFAELSAAETSASEVYLDGIMQVQVSLIRADGSRTTLTLDPSKSYAVTSCTLPCPDNTVVSYRCSGYQSVGGTWVPSTASIERRDALTDRLLHSDQWTLEVVDSGVPGPGSFTVDIEPDTAIEYFSPLTAASSSYIYSYSVDTDRLLAERLDYAATERTRPQNCATAALRYVASQLGKPISDNALASLVGPEGRTSMYALKQFVQGQGLYCRAVQTDIATLKNLGEARAILHIPGDNHFVVLDVVDDRDVRLIDLSSRRFYYRRSTDSFPMEWSQRVVLIVSRKPVLGPLQDIDDDALATIFGSGGWTCTKQLQKLHWFGCLYPCEGIYEIYPERWGCESAPSGNCISGMYVRCQESDCLPHPIYWCTITGEWTFYYMVACY